MFEKAIPWVTLESSPGQFRLLALCLKPPMHDMVLSHLEDSRCVPYLVIDCTTNHVTAGMKTALFLNLQHM